MVSAVRNDLMTRIGPGTPAAELLRRYWQPVALIEELPEKRPLKAVRLMGQSFVLFKDDQGRYGMLDRDCPHRGADLAFGRLEHGGLRCAFHGWLFDVTGQCRETPAEPAGSKLCEGIRQKSYPVVLKSGILFAYIGPGEPPAFPHFDCFVAPDEYTFAFKGLFECNWLQALEVGIDPAHASFLHRFFEDQDAKASYGKQFRGASADSDMPITKVLREYDRPEILVQSAPYGLRLIALRKLDDAKTHVRVTNLVFPQAFVIPMSAEMTISQWHVPIDDYSCYWFAIFTSFGAPTDKEAMRAQRLGLYELPDYRPRKNKSNHYGFNPDEQLTETYTGMGSDINVHDQWAIESQGPIANRTREHLGTTDKGIITYRRMLIDAIEKNAAGDKAPMLINANEAQALSGPAAIDGIGPAAHWDEYWRESDRERRRAAAWASKTAGSRLTERTYRTMSFVERFALWTSTQQAAAKDLMQRLQAKEVEVVRFSFPDQHGVLRGKTLVVGAAIEALVEGVSITTTLFAKDTSHKSVFPVFAKGGGFERAEMQGGADALMVADPTTFRVLPWAPHTGWLLCDMYFPSGEAVPVATRQLFRQALDRLDSEGFRFVAGLEVEFHVFKLVDTKMRPEDAGQPGTPPEVMLLSHGYQYLTELRYDAIDPVVEMIRRDLVQLELPVRSLEVEFGPSQFEFTFTPMEGMAAADAMVLFRAAVKQICRRNGFHATFMCRPRLPNVFSSGWHLHQSLVDRDDGSNAFMAERREDIKIRDYGSATHPDGNAFKSEGGDDILSQLGYRYLAGLLAHARAACALAAPTINGYRRYRPYSLAPDRVIWGRDNRGAMVRVLGAPGDSATRLENRIGEPAANPYLYFASQVLSGLDGIKRQLDPGLSADTPYESPAPRLPQSLAEALACLKDDTCLTEGLGSEFVRYFCTIKEAELARFELQVTEWEQREYFDMF